MPTHYQVVFNRYALFRWSPTPQQWKTICDFAEEHNCRHYALLSLPALSATASRPGHQLGSVRVTVEHGTSNDFTFEWRDHSVNEPIWCDLSQDGRRIQLAKSGSSAANWDLTDFIQQSAMAGNLTEESVLPAFEFTVEYIGQTEQRWTPRLNRLRSHHRLPKLNKRLGLLQPARQLWVMLLSQPVLNAVARDGVGVPLDAPSPLESISQEALHRSATHGQFISVIEAGLIKLFNPRWNRTFKATFPSKRHRSYRHFTTLGIGALSVELHLQGTPFRLRNIHGEYRRMLSSQVTLGDFDQHFGKPGHGPDDISDEALWSFMPDGYFGGSVLVPYDSECPTAVPANSPASLKT